MCIVDEMYIFLFQYFDAVGWAAGRRPACKKTEWWMLVWLSVWSKVQTCICPSWCHCKSLSLASVKSRIVFPFLVPAHPGSPGKGPLNVCMHVCIYYVIFFYILRTSRMFLCCWQEFHVTSVITRWSKTCCGCRESRLFTPWTSGRSRSTKSSSLYIWPSVRILCTHPFNGPFLGLPGWAGTRKVEPVWILLKQETVSGSGINWAICRSAPHSRQITTPAPHHSVFYRPDALPATQPTASKHWRCISYTAVKPTWLDSTGRRSSIPGVTQVSFTVLPWYCFVSLFLYSLVTLYH